MGDTVKCPKCSQTFEDGQDVDCIRRYHCCCACLDAELRGGDEWDAAMAEGEAEW